MLFPDSLLLTPRAFSDQLSGISLASSGQLLQKVGHALDSPQTLCGTAKLYKSLLELIWQRTSVIHTSLA